MNENYIVAIDLGQSSVKAVAGVRREDGTFQIAAVAERKMRGVTAGRIENVMQVNESLSRVIAELEERLNVKILAAYTAISGEYVRSAHQMECVPVSDANGCVSHRDMKLLCDKMYNIIAPPSDTILEGIAQNYLVDGRGEVKNPVGRFGSTLSSIFNFTLCESEAKKRLALAFSNAGIEMRRCYANSIMAAEAVLSSDEKEGGVAVVDLGEGMTNVAVYYNGVLRSIASIPLGAAAINHDIRSLMIQERIIEEVKCDHGSAIADIDDVRLITVAGRTPRESKNIPIYNLSVAIQERMVDIIKYVQREIRDAGYDGRLLYGVVLTGGGAQLNRVDELFAKELKLNVRVALPDDDIDNDTIELVNSPAYATVIGILKRGFEQGQRGKDAPCTAPIIEPEPEPEPEPESNPESNPEGGAGSRVNTNPEGGSDAESKDDGEGSLISKAKDFVGSKIFGSLFRSDEDPNDQKF